MKTRQLVTLRRVLVSFCGLLLAFVGTARAVSNSTNIYESGGVTNVGVDYYVGSNGTNNYMEVRNATTVTNSGSGFVDWNASYNRAVITGSGSAWNQGSYLFVGRAGDHNQLVITNGGTVYTAGMCYLGSYYSTDTNNSVVVSGTGSSWTVQGRLWLGYKAAQNEVLVENGGVLSVNNTDGIWIGYMAPSNKLTVTSGGSATAPALWIGSYVVAEGSNGACAVQGGTLTVTNAAGNAYLRVYYGGKLTVGGGGVVRVNRLIYDTTADSLNFVATAAGPGTIYVTSDFTIGANTKLNVDLTGYTFGPNDVLTLVIYGSMPVPFNSTNITLTGGSGLILKQGSGANSGITVQPQWTGPMIRAR